MGLRYEFSSVIKEAHNLLGNFDPNSPTGLIQVGQNGVSGPYNPDRNNFAPRIGFAWDMFGTGNTVLRGGFGLMYEAVNWESFLAFNNSFGLSNVPTGAVISGTGTPNQKTAGGTITAGNLAIPPGIIPPWDSSNPLYGNVSGTTINCDPNASGPCPIMSVVRNLTTPYIWTWSVNVQHAFTPNISFELAYVGNRGSNLTGIRDANQEALGSNDQTTRPQNANFSYLSNIFQMGNFYRSNYNGLQATLSSRNYHGLSMVAGYTYSHALDDVGANWDFGAGYGLPQDSNNVAREYGNSDFDIRHRLTLSLTYAVPGKKGFGQMLEGWEINTIATLQSPQPWGVIDLTTGIAGIGGLPVSPPQATPQRWDFIGKPSDFKSGSTPIPFFPGDADVAGQPHGKCRMQRTIASHGRRNSWQRYCIACNLWVLCQRYLHLDSAPYRSVWNDAAQSVPGRRLPEPGFLSGQELPLRGTPARAIPGRILQHPEPPKFRQSLWWTERLRAERSWGTRVRLRMYHT